MSQNFEVTVLSFSEEKDNTAGQDYFKRKLPDVKFIEPIYHPIHIHENIPALFKAFFLAYLSNQPYVVTKFKSRDMFRAIDHELMQNEYDAIFLDYLNVSQYREYIRRKYPLKRYKYIFKDHNIEANIFKQFYMDQPLSIKKLIAFREWKAVERYEVKAAEKADLVLTVSYKDAEKLKSHNRSVFTTPPLVDEIKQVKNGKKEHIVSYIGNLSWIPNRQGVQWFIDSVLPKVAENVQDVKLKIIGSGLSDNPFSHSDHIEYLGYVENLEEVYRETKVFIVPLFMGSGVRIKIIEAINHEVAVVSTSLGCEGLGLCDGHTILIADNADHFADNVINLLKDDELSGFIVKNAKSFLVTRYSGENIYKELNKIVSALTREEAV